MMSFESQLSLFVEGLRELQIEFSDEQQGQIACYLEELTLFNPRLKLVAAENEELVIKHLLDSVAGAPIISSLSPRATTLCDVGSGAGLPGLILAIALPTFHVTLIERSQRRCGFLRNAISRCRLHERVKVAEMDVVQYDQQCDVVVMRAVQPLGNIIEALGSLCAPGGMICAYKGRLDTLEVELKEISDSKWESTVRAITVPFLEAERHLAILRRRGE